MCLEKEIMCLEKSTNYITLQAEAYKPIPLSILSFLTDGLFIPVINHDILQFKFHCWGT
jgi:hypothetical protein